MAKPIALVPVPSEHQQGARDELLRKIEAAPLEHAKALMALWDLLEVAHERQLIDIAHGLIATSDYVVDKLAEGAGLPSSIQAMRNAIMLAQMLGSLDPEVMHRLVQGMPNAMQQGTANAAADKPPSLWKSIKGFMSEDGRRALAMFSGITVGLGAALNPAKKRD